MGQRGPFFLEIILYYFYRILRTIKCLDIIIAGKWASVPATLFWFFWIHPWQMLVRWVPWEISPLLITSLETKNQFQHTANNTKYTCMHCMPLSKWNKLCKRFQLNTTNPVAQRRQKKITQGLWRWTRWRDLGWEVHGKELIISVVRDLTDSLLCVFSCSKNSCLCLSVDRWQVMMVFSSPLII